MFISPMLLESRPNPFDDPRFIYEPKIDGHRLLLSFIDGKTQLYTRHENDCTRQYPELHSVPIVDGVDVILDGEVAVFDADGNVDFDGVMDRFRTTKDLKIKLAANREPVNYVVFDILYYNGQDLRNKPLMERKAILDKVLQNNSFFTKTSYIDHRGSAFFDVIKQRGLEGIVAKRKDSRYVSKKSSNWIKIINYHFYEVYISGYRKDQFGWLAHFKDKKGKMRPAGIIEYGVLSEHKRRFYKEAVVSGEDRNYIYVLPETKAIVKTRGWTKNGMLRTPAFVEFIM